MGMLELIPAVLGTLNVQLGRCVHQAFGGVDVVGLFSRRELVPWLADMGELASLVDRALLQGLGHYGGGGQR